MAVQKDYLMTRKDGVKLYRNYSDEGKYIIQDQTGVKYGEAIDVESAPYTYTETDELIPVPEEEKPVEDAPAE